MGPHRSLGRGVALVVFLLLACGGAAGGARATVIEISRPFSGDAVPVRVELDDRAAPDAVEISISIAPGTGSLLGMFGNVADESLLPDTVIRDVSGHLSQWKLEANGVSRVGSWNHMGIAKTWDWGVRFAPPPGEDGPVVAVRFAIEAPGLDVQQLLSSPVLDWVFGVRIVETGGAVGSSKMALRRQAPRLRIAAPAEGARLGSPQVEVRGWILAGDGSVRVNGAPANVDGESFAARSVLVEGTNRLEARSENWYAAVTDAVYVEVDTMPPVVTLLEPVDGMQTAEPEVRVTGGVSDASPLASVVVNGVAVDVGAGGFEALVPLVVGANEITVTAVDAVGNESQAAVRVVRVGETEGLAVAIDAPPDGARVSVERIRVTGTVSDPWAAVSVNGMGATVEGDRWAVPSMRLAIGPNLLAAVATRGSDRAEDARSVVYDLPPKVVITTPIDGARVRSELVRVEGYVDDPAAFVDVNGIPASVGALGRFEAESVPLAPGENRLQARAVDPFGGMGADEVGVERIGDLAGRMRLVLVAPGRTDRASGGIDRAIPVVVENGEEFRRLLGGLGYPLELFVPAVEHPAFVMEEQRGFHLFAFVEIGEQGDLVSVPMLAEAFPSASADGVLQPMAVLDDELALAGLDPAIREELVPDDFTPAGFARLSAEMEAPR